MASPQTRLIEYLPSSQRQRLLLRLMRQPAGRQLRHALGKVHPADIAQLFPLLRPEEQLHVLEILFEQRLAASTLSELDPEIQKQLLGEISDQKLVVILGSLPADDAVDLLEGLEEERRQGLLATLDKPLAARLGNLMVHGGTTAGGLMNPDVVFFRADQSVAHTLEAIREIAEGRRLFYLYVTDDRGHLIGLANLWRLLTADRESVLREIMSADVVSVKTDTPQEEVARVFSRYDLLLMPVLDEDGRLVGVITVDDIIDVIEEEASTDLHRLGNLPAQEGLGVPLARSLRLRLPWLMVNLATALPAAALVAVFADSLAKYVVLAAFLPVLIAMGGYAGTQTLTVMVASLATGDMDLRRSRRVVAQQTLIGLANGLATGAVLALVAWLWERSLPLSAILLAAQTANTLAAGFLGATVPLALHRLDLDPALGSPIFVTAAVNLMGLGCFLGLAALLIEKLM
jgi:magnesium transporter